MVSICQVFNSIARCPNVDRCLDGDTHHPCSTIVQSQHAGKADFQLPEPWRGQIDKARILFIGSNPHPTPRSHIGRRSAPERASCCRTPSPARTTSSLRSCIANRNTRKASAKQRRPATTFTWKTFLLRRPQRFWSCWARSPKKRSWYARPASRGRRKK